MSDKTTHFGFEEVPYADKVNKVAGEIKGPSLLHN